MKLLIATTLAIVLASGLVFAQGTLSVPFTAEQQAGVVFSLGLVNAQRAKEGLPPLGLVPYARSVCQAVFTSYAEQRAAAREQQASVRAKYLSLSDADKAQVEALIDSLVNP